MAPKSKSDLPSDTGPPAAAKKVHAPRENLHVPYSRSEKLTIAALVISVLACIVAVFAWLQPQRKVESDELLDGRIGRAVDAKQKPLSDKVDTIASKIDNLSGRLESIEPYVRSLVLKQMANASTLPPKKLSDDVPQLADASEAGRSSGVSIDTATLSKLRVNLSQIHYQNSEAYWTLSSNLLGMRAVSIPSSRSCYEIPAQKIAILGMGVYKVLFENCVIDIGNIDGFTRGKWYERLWAMSEGKAPDITIELTDARIIYNGGPVLPVKGIVFENCLFDFHLRSDPQSSPGRSIMRTLLASDDLQHTNVKFVDGGQGL